METDEEKKARVDAFLAEYKSLCERHQLIINACGCCNSPMIESPHGMRGGPSVSENVEHLADYVLNWIDPIGP